MNRQSSAMVLEGGANRGIFTAGVLDYLMECDFWTDYVVGVSAGACNAVDYVSRQPGRSRDCIIAWNQEKKRDQLKNLREEHSIIDMRMLFDTFPNHLYPFDFDTYFNSDMKCELVVTNCLTGKPEYRSETEDAKRLMRLCRASSSLPMLSPKVMLDGEPFYDGGLADSIPVLHTRKLGYEKIIVVLTQMAGYQKTTSSKQLALLQARYHRYPNMVRSYALRAERYNKSLEHIAKWEAAGKLFVIRPEITPVKRLEKNEEKLNVFYKHGYDLMGRRYDELRAYMEA
ncbi:MAG: patatin family protein [Eubacteriales bacterium]|nr:patatin family protein [Eubacteriales bacterium]